MSDENINPEDPNDETLSDDDLEDVAGGCGPEESHRVGEAV